METGELGSLGFDDLTEWHRLSELLSEVKAKEMALRKKIFSFCFTMPREGTNKLSPEIATCLGITDGFVLKGNYKVNRKVDEAVARTLNLEFLARQINTEVLIKWSAALSTTEYRTLTEEQRVFFDQCLIITPGSPELEIVLPKRK